MDAAAEAGRKSGLNKARQLRISELHASQTILTLAMAFGILELPGFCFLIALHAWGNNRPGWATELNWVNDLFVLLDRYAISQGATIYSVLWATSLLLFVASAILSSSLDWVANFASSWPVCGFGAPAAPSGTTPWSAAARASQSVRHTLPTKRAATIEKWTALQTVRLLRQWHNCQLPLNCPCDKVITHTHTSFATNCYRTSNTVSLCKQ